LFVPEGIFCAADRRPIPVCTPASL
jgi:hypothetical protein